MSFESHAQKGTFFPIQGFDGVIRPVQRFQSNLNPGQGSPMVESHMRLCGREPLLN